MQGKMSEEVQNIEEIRRTNNLTAKTTSPVTLPIININADISRYNPREPETLKLSGKSLLEKYFSTIQL